MNLILAADQNWAIGKDGKLLCHLSGDLKYFKEKTLGKTVVIGRKTFENLPGGKPLPGRENIILTRNRDYKAEGAEVVHSLKELKEVLRGRDTDDIFIAGGGEVYRDLFPQCDTCYVTRIYRTFEADTFFTDLDKGEDFELVWQSGPHTENGTKYRFLEYRRKRHGEKQAERQREHI